MLVEQATSIQRLTPHGSECLLSCADCAHCNLPNNRLVSCLEDNAQARPFENECATEHDILGFHDRSVSRNCCP